MRYDRDGMYPAHSCRACGKPLNAGGWHPAELYAGTYDGLCYVCTDSREYPEREERSGAVVWNFPPHCPAWRRDREVFFGFADCQGCGGRGRIEVHRPSSAGGSYGKQCEECNTRHYKHPAVLLAQAESMDSLIMRRATEWRRQGYSASEVLLAIEALSGRALVNKTERAIIKSMCARHAWAPLRADIQET